MNNFAFIMLLIISFGLIACQRTETVSANFACDAINAEYFGARYIIEEGGHDAHNDHEHEKAEGTQFTVWRMGQMVAHEYEDHDITFLYSNGSGERLLKHQFFDADKRAIEFDSRTIAEHEKGTLWSQKKNLVSDELLKRMETVSERGEGCNSIKELAFETQGSSFDLIWLSEFQLPLSLITKGTSGDTHLKLIEIIGSEEEIKLAFAQRDKYISTDFADIGDNETDPFLRNMINLGFIDHGNSGFYDSEGNDIGGGHGHAH